MQNRKAIPGFNLQFMRISAIIHAVMKKLVVSAEPCTRPETNSLAPSVSVMFLSVHVVVPQLPASGSLRSLGGSRVRDRHELGYVRRSHTDHPCGGSRVASCDNLDLGMHGGRRLRRPRLADFRHDGHGVGRGAVQPRRAREDAVALCRPCRMRVVRRISRRALHRQRGNCPRRCRRDDACRAFRHPRHPSPSPILETSNEWSGSGAMGQSLVSTTSIPQLQLNSPTKQATGYTGRLFSYKPLNL